VRLDEDARGGRDFFVSYTQADRRWAEWIAWVLEEDGYRVLIQAWDFVPGSNWIHGMQAGVRDATRTIAVLSDAYMGSVYGSAEWQAAWRRDPDGTNRKLLVVRVAPCERPGLLAGIVGVDLFGVSDVVAGARLRDMVTAAEKGRAKPALAPRFPGNRAIPADPGFPGKRQARGPSRLVRTLTGYPGGNRWDRGVKGLAFSPDGILLASAGGDKTVRLWESDTGGPVRTLIGHTSEVLAVAFSPDGRMLASGAGFNIKSVIAGGIDKKVRVWDVASGGLADTLRGHASWVNSLAFSPDGALLASAGEDRTVRLWTAATGTVIRTLTGHKGGVNAVAFSPDGGLLASAAAEETVRLWDVATGALVDALTLHRGGVLAVAFSPDGAMLASAGADHTIRLWDTATGARVRVLAGHADWVRTVAFSPDGVLLASGGHDKTVRIWEAATGVTVRTLTGHSDIVRSVVFSPDNTNLASAGDDKKILLWR
jgi:WD40 repeat protein